MIEEVSVTLRKQTASEGCWLYQDQLGDMRYFTKFVYLAPKDTEWPECTEEERAAWQEAWDKAHETR